MLVFYLFKSAATTALTLIIALAVKKIFKGDENDDGIDVGDAIRKFAYLMVLIVLPVVCFVAPMHEGAIPVINANYLALMELAADVAYALLLISAIWFVAVALVCLLEALAGTSDETVAKVKENRRKAFRLMEGCILSTAFLIELIYIVSQNASIIENLTKTLLSMNVVDLLILLQLLITIISCIYYYYVIKDAIACVKEMHREVKAAGGLKKFCKIIHARIKHSKEVRDRMKFLQKQEER